MKNSNISLLDAQQLQSLMFDVDNDAQRVVIVGGDGQSIANSIKEGLQGLKLDIPAPIVNIEAPPVPVTTTASSQIQVIEVPVIVKETEVKVIEMPVVVTDVQIVQVDRPVIIKEIEIREIKVATPSHSKLVTALLIAQTLASIILSALHFLKK